MSKEQILEAFYKDHKFPDGLKQLIATDPELFTKDPQDPCNFYHEQPLIEEEHFEQKSDISAFSEIGLSAEKYQEILANRAIYRIFSVISDNQNLEMNVWFYKDKEGKGFGPFNCLQMDGFFQNGEITEECKIQGPSEFYFLPFRLFLRRFLKKVQSEKSKELPSEQKQAIKQEKIRNPAKTAGLLIERKYRILSLEVKPNLSFLDEVMEDSELCEIVQTRCRSSTMGQ